VLVDDTIPELLDPMREVVEELSLVVLTPLDDWVDRIVVKDVGSVKEVLDNEVTIPELEEEPSLEVVEVLKPLDVIALLDDRDGNIVLRLVESEVPELELMIELICDDNDVTTDVKVVTIVRPVLLDETPTLLDVVTLDVPGMEDNVVGKVGIVTPELLEDDTVGNIVKDVDTVEMPEMVEEDPRPVLDELVGKIVKVVGTLDRLEPVEVEPRPVLEESVGRIVGSVVGISELMIELMSEDRDDTTDVSVVIIVSPVLLDEEPTIEVVVRVGTVKADPLDELPT